MEYQAAANVLFDLGRFPPGTGLEPTRELLGHLGDPHEGLAVVQVAGSNGKGSTSRMVERVLREAGLDVGLYTSPHLDDVRERVQVNGRPVTKARAVEFVDGCRAYLDRRAAANASPTFFETLTALALWEFDRQAVDVAVLEVGIGGRYDATSVCDPVASAVTSVTLEHADLLGDTVAEIAHDKAHVAPASAPLVTATAGEALDAIRDVADGVVRVGSDDGADVTVEYGGREGIEGVLDLAGPDWGIETRLPLLGAHQSLNAGVAAALCRQVGAATGGEVTEAHLERGLRNAHWPGRFEVMGREPLVILDSAHNPGSAERVTETLDSFDYGALYLVVGAMADKDHAGMAEAFPRADRVYTCRPGMDRAETAEALAVSFEDSADAVEVMSDVPGALDAALGEAGPEDAVVVTGSLFTVAEARRRWSRTQVYKRVPDTETAGAVLSDADVSRGEAERLSGEGVHRTLRVRVEAGRAETLRGEALAAGVTPAVSGVEPSTGDLVDAVLSGTLGEFDRLVDRLVDRGHGLGRIAVELRRTAGLESVPEDAHGHRSDRDYPWADESTAVMGVLNVTPDSFHDGGEYDTVEDATRRAERMVDAGVDVLDVGGESTRPGAEPVPVEAEIERVAPVIEAVADLDALVSIDTRKAEVARAALDAGADILNDVSGLEDPEMRLVAAERDVPAVVMHSVNAPVDPDVEVAYDDVVEDTLDALTERVLLAEKAGLDRSQVIVDPGLGFGKSRRENFELLDRLGEFRSLGCPVLVGHSHKSMFDLVGYEDGERLPATIAATALAAERGADIVRVHDVPENVAAVRTVEATRDPDSV
ncbi:MAG: dihydropteroate synthase [Haloarculaceae archaeon]